MDHDHRTCSCFDLAGAIQANLLPAHAPAVPGLDVHGACRYSAKLGGDYFDYLDYAEACCRCNTRFRLVVGDVSGHGVAAALIMTTVRAYIRNRATQTGPIDDIVADVNRLLVRDVVHTGHFMTMFFLDVSVADKTLSWVRAGHDPALLFDETTDTFEQLHGPGIPIGVEADYAFSLNSRPGLQPGQLLLIGTDGIWEATNAHGQAFGKERLQGLIRANARNTAKALVDALFQELDAFTGHAPLQDDTTVVVLKATEA